MANDIEFIGISKSFSYDMRLLHIHIYL